MTAPARNLELKAHDPDPERSLELALALGAEDRGVLEQRDTYFARASGRLKLREEAGRGAELIEYARANQADPRPSDYRIVPVPDPEALRAALHAALGTLTVVEKRRRLLLWEGVRIHLDRVAGLGDFLELEAVAAPGADLEAERPKVERLREAIEVGDERLVAEGYADLMLADPELLLRAADEVMRMAHAPYSNFKVGAVLRGASGRLFTGANVENAAFPQGQCAEASAIGALVAGGERQITAVAVVAERMDVCPPCGGCRQRLSEFAGPETPVHLGRPGGEQRTVTLADLLPLSFDLKP